VPWFVYIVECSDGTLYCGITCDLERRVNEHNGLQPGGAKYTRSRRPVRLVSNATFQNRSEALKAEYEVKKIRKDKKVQTLKAFSGDAREKAQSVF
jgi:putative endonuclease